MLKENMHEKANRLIKEKSPYLLQHAYNPVDWYPWSEEAFLKAKSEDKPIFLSIGYSTCHWCHVMERESFEDKDVADILNKNFISIKVDREERPDVDAIYMGICQSITGSGGWPLTIIMTPDKKPFFVATYIPKDNRYGMMGLIDRLNLIKDAWKDKKKDILDSSDNIINAIKENNYKCNEDEIDKNIIEDTFNNLCYTFESKYGGFSKAPKFPTPHNLYFLLRYWRYKNSKKALDMVTKTLDSMYAGGIFDHIGFGFSRYSTDERWLVPHFEKMLYDNALLAIIYGEAYLATDKELYKNIADKIMSYVFREMKHEEGGFYSAEDADSEGEEGKFYIWSYDEIFKVLKKDEGELFCKYYDIKKEGNFEGKNIPNLIQTDINKIENDNTLKSILEDINKILFEHRQKRVHPYKDDKILTSWNGLMIAALSYCGSIFHNITYINEAKKAVEFIFKNLVTKEGRLLARYRQGDSNYYAYCDDYAFLIWGLIELYQATLDINYLTKALTLNEDLYEHFWDKENGGFFLYGDDSEELILRPKEIYDGSTPSGNSVAALNLLRLAKITENKDFEDRAVEIFKTFISQVKNVPNAYTFLMIAIFYNTIGTREIVISSNDKDTEVKKFMKEINKIYDPFCTIVLNDNSDKVLDILSNIKDKKPIDGKATVYICENFACKEGINNIDEAINIIRHTNYDLTNKKN